jgi:N-acetyl-anhydromuramyl-L-alanine amidase AmpD
MPGLVRKIRLSRLPLTTGVILATSVATAGMTSTVTATAGTRPAAGVPRQQALPQQALPQQVPPRPGGRMAEFSAAARESGVPVSLLLAVGYNESRWAPHGSEPSADGGYGLMDLAARSFRAANARGVAAAGQPHQATLRKTRYTLVDAARLLHVSQAALVSSERQNVRGAAAVLASIARRLNGGRLPTSLGGWYPAVAAYTGYPVAQTAELFANDVFGTLRNGATLTTPDGQVMRLAAAPGVRPDRAGVARLGLRQQPRSSAPVDCPPDLNCRFVPAAYAEDPGGDPGNYGDYDLAQRPADLKINSIVIHDTEGSYASAIATFQDPASYVSANYVIQSSTGDITEMVRPQDVAWAVGDWYYNTHSISIEHEGFAAQGAAWYTEAMYKASAELGRYLAQRYHVPLDRRHIIGHDNVPGPTDGYTAAQHWDPGPFWNWTHYMALVHGTSLRAERASAGSAGQNGHKVVVIVPAWSRNRPVITDCSSGTCVTLPKQPANFVYLHTRPASSAPLLPDPVLHPDGSAGTTQDSDWSDKAPSGTRYVFAGRHGTWTAIWYGGQEGWFYNPPGKNRTARYTGGTVITPRPGLASIPVYGSAFPEASAYPSVVPAQPNNPLSYTIKAGQEYLTTGMVPDDYYYAVTIDSSKPDDHTVITGKTGYYQISYNHRLFYVKAADVVVKHLG